jgi:hypothetical protein
MAIDHCQGFGPACKSSERFVSIVVPIDRTTNCLAEVRHGTAEFRDF